MNPLDFFDRYVLIARVFVALIVIAPLVPLLAAAISWQRLSWTRVLGSAVAVVIVFYVMGDLARQRGRAIEPDLIRQMGGLPSTIMMRHSDPTFDPGTKEQLHEFLASKLKTKAPTAVDEANNPAAADQFYVSGANWLRENTRDQKKFNILFNENVSYGFQRNLLGLRTLAFVFDALVVMICVTWLLFRRPLNIKDRMTMTFVILIGIAILHAAYFEFAVTQQIVIAAARLYGRQLILSFEAFPNA